MIPWILCAILLIAVLLLLAKIHVMRRSMAELCAQFRDRLSKDTNNLLYISSQDQRLRLLAREINIQLRLLRRQRRQYLNGDLELKNAVTNISHDLRTPLTAICGYLQLLEQEEKSEAVSSYIRQIENRTAVLKSLTEEFFRYSVLTSEEELSPSEVVLNHVLEESLVSNYGALTARHITPELSITEIPVHRTLDASALGRIFENIISNALKYSDGNLSVSLTEKGAITFANRAKGLTPVMAERLFDRFYTVETGSSSTGLGLSIARLLTERMGGTIRAGYTNGILSIHLYFPE